MQYVGNVFAPRSEWSGRDNIISKKRLRDNQQKAIFNDAAVIELEWKLIKSLKFKELGQIKVNIVSEIVFACPEDYSKINHVKI